MADTITLFFNLTPNNRNTFYAVSSQTNYNFQGSTLDMWGISYLNFLKTYNPYNVTADKRYVELTPTTYKIYNEYIDLPINAVESDLHFAFITYLAIASNSTRNSAQKWLFYYVNSFVMLNDRIRIFVTPDYWGTYCGYAKFKDVTITRTNCILSAKTAYRREEVPLINNAYKNYHRISYKANTAGGSNAVTYIGDLRIYAVIQYEGGDITNKKNHINLFQFNPADITGTPVTYASIERACQIIAGIYGRAGILASLGYKAQIQKIYIFDNSLSVNTTRTQTFAGGIDNETVTLTGTIVNWYVQSIDLLLNIGNIPVPTGYNYIGPVVNIFANLSFGTKYSSIKLPAFYGSYSISFEVHPADDKLIFLIRAGEEELDITSEFELGVVANTNITPLEGLNRILTVGGSAASGAFQFAAGGAGYISGGLQIAQLPEQLTKIGQNSYKSIPSGNGFNTWRDVLLDGSGSALYVIEHGNGDLSDAAQTEYLSRGLDCMQLVSLSSNQNKLFAYYHGLTKIAGDDYVIQALASVYDVPSIAQDEIREALREGVKLVYIN